MAFWIAAISLGLFGSFHCLGMCGPIALALPVQQFEPLTRVVGIFIYNLGRAITYALFGILFGLLGQAFFMGGFQQVLSISVGILLLLSVFLPSFFTSFRFKFYQNFNFQLKAVFQDLFRKKGVPVLFLIGLLNGLLPCGLVYVAIAAATATGNYLNGALFMLVFGLGTFPVMVALPFFGQFIKVKYRNQIRKAVPVMVSLMALLFILRGLNLGIPYLSPRTNGPGKNSMECHSASSAQESKALMHCSPDNEKEAAQTGTQKTTKD